MNLYLITRTTEWDWDNYDSAVVAAESEDDAKAIHPDGREDAVTSSGVPYDSWVPIEQVKVENIGVAKPFTKRGVVCASFNAG